MRTRSARIDDFQTRAKADPDAVHCDRELGRYLAVHPMADDAKLLQRLRIDASACTKVDLFWRRADDVSFVQVESRRYSRDRKPGYYARNAPSGYLNIVAVIAEELVTSRVVLRVLRDLANRPIAARSLSDALQSI
jgi:hypothetical protein